MDNNMLMMIAGGVVIVIGLWWIFGSSAESNTPKSQEEIIKLLTAQGYQIKEIEFDDGVYEVEAYQNGKEFELKVDRLGKIIHIEQDD